MPGLTVPSSGSGSLIISGTPTAAGTETFTVTATDTVGAQTNSSYSLTVNPAATSPLPTATTITASASTDTLGQMTPVMFTAQVAALASGAGTPDGAVTFEVAGQPLPGGSDIPLNNGQAGFSTSDFQLGVNNVTASYSGSTQFSPSTSGVGPDSLIANVAGVTRQSGPSQSTNPASATLNYPNAIAIDPGGDLLFIADTNNNVVRAVNLSAAALTLPDGTLIPAGQIITVAGSGVAGYDGGTNSNPTSATSAELDNPFGLAWDAASDLLFIADTGNNIIREVNFSASNITLPDGSMLPPGDIGAVAGSQGQVAISPTNVPLINPFEVALDANGDLFFTGQNLVRAINLSGSSVTLPDGTVLPPDQIVTIAGVPGQLGYNGNDLPATSATLYYPQGITVDIAGDVFFSDAYNQRIREVPASGIDAGKLINVAGDGHAGYWNGIEPPLSAMLYNPNSVAVDSAGDIFITDQANGIIREIPVSGPNAGNLVPIAGGGSDTYGQGELATNASLYDPRRHHAGLGRRPVYRRQQQRGRARSACRRGRGRAGEFGGVACRVHSISRLG